VEILQHQDQRPLGSQTLHRFRELAQHPRPRHPAGLALERLALGLRQQRRHLRQPARRVLPQQRDQPGTLRIAAEAPQSFQEREEGLSHPILLDTLPVADPDGPVPGEAVYKGLHHRRLADADLAGDEDHLAHALPCLRPPLLELSQLAFARHHQVTRVSI
jgi:hypothetical protein